jgi:hypothetical protein
MSALDRLFADCSMGVLFGNALDAHFGHLVIGDVGNDVKGLQLCKKITNNN